MSALLDELYFEWLYSQVASVKTKNPSKTYWKILNILFKKEFVWIVPNDDNRIEDGKELRYEFIEECKPEVVDQNWMELGCSMLELFVGLSRRLAFETNAPPYEWFWEIMENLDLVYNDAVHIPRDRVEEKLDRVIWRNYRPNGRGGLFPLRKPRQDQREVEIWYQLNAYLLERD